MVEKKNGLYHNLGFIIHPGETIKEALTEKNISQEELALRTGFSAKHISEVINGIKDISPSFAKALEYALDTPAYFWINLQAIYDKDIIEYRDRKDIDEIELKIVEDNKKIIKYAQELEIIEKNISKEELVIALRKICKVKDLFFINILQRRQFVASVREKIKDTDYELFIWICICELLARKKEKEYTKNYDKGILEKSITKIKKCIKLEDEVYINRLIKIFKECGIVLQVMQNKKDLKLKGFVKKIDNKVLMVVVINNNKKDFWFTLFHEIGHLINDDVERKIILDLNKSDSKIEKLADKYAIEELKGEL